MTASDRNSRRPRHRSIRLRCVVFCVLVMVPVVAHQVWQRWSALPPVVRIATGTQGGRYRQVAEALGAALRERLGVTIEFVESRGSVRNLDLLRRRQVDFALVQPEADGVGDDESTPYRSVANVYSEAVLLLVRQGSGISSLRDFQGRVVSVGPLESGDAATARIVLEHVGLSIEEGDIEAVYFDYPRIQAAFRDGSLDAAIVTVGLDADFLSELAVPAQQEQPVVRIIGIPYREALVLKRLSLQLLEIPAGAFRSALPVMPRRPVQTVAVRAQLVTHAQVPVELVEETTRILTDLRFDRNIQLRELVHGGFSFAKEQTIFPLHKGASQFYDPELKPLLPSDFVEATEGLRSFVVSILVAGWLTIRWWRQTRERAQEHRLDRCIQNLLAIEQRQMDLDQTDSGEDVQMLQQLLDEVTALRQAALGELTAHELNDDPAAAAFIQMCHALSEKINAKLTRQRFDARMRQLMDQCGRS